MSPLNTIDTPSLRTAYRDEGPTDGWPVVLAHGFPYDIHAFDEVVPRVVRAGARVIVPYLRGFGPTQFLSKETMRSGQQAALGRDLINILDALGIQHAILAGYDWGGARPASLPRSGRTAWPALFPTQAIMWSTLSGTDVPSIRRSNG